MTDGTAAAGTYTLELSDSEVATVVEALRLLLGSLGHGDGDQIEQIEAMLARLPASSD